MNKKEIRKALVELTEYRKKNFAVKIEPCRHHTFKGEFVLLTTQNGFQWSGIPIAPHELPAILKELRKKEAELRKSALIK